MARPRRLLAGEARLSWLQQDILRFVCLETAWLEKAFRAQGKHDHLAQLQAWGLEWHPHQWWHRHEVPWIWTPTDRAVFSRALRRLEQRGLIERKNARTGMPGRTTHVRLTEQGRKIARRHRRRP